MISKLTTNVRTHYRAAGYCRRNNIRVPSPQFYAHRNDLVLAPGELLQKTPPINAIRQCLREPLASTGPRILRLLELHSLPFQQLMKFLDGPSKVMVRNNIRNLPSLTSLASIFARGDGDMCVAFYHTAQKSQLAIHFAFHASEGNGRRGFKAMLVNGNMFGGFSPERVTSNNGRQMDLTGWRVGVLALIATTFGFSVKKHAQLKLIAQALCSALIGIHKSHGASLRRQTPLQFDADRLALDRELKRLKHEEDAITQRYYTRLLNLMGDFGNHERVSCYMANFLDADAHANRERKRVEVGQSDLPLLRAFKVKLQAAYGLGYIRICNANNAAYYPLHPNQKQAYKMKLSQANSIILKRHLQNYSFSTINDPRGIRFWDVIA